jgi:hypothetical protein
MNSGERIHIYVSSQDRQYLRDRLISPTALLRDAIRYLRSVDKRSTGDNVT